MNDRHSNVLARRIAAAAFPVVVASGLCSAGIAHATGRSTAATTGWHVTKTIATPNTVLTSVAAVAGGDAWVGGESPSQTPVIYQFAGGKWHLASLSGPTGSFVNSVSATSSTNAWATVSNEPDVAQLTGSGWKLISFANGADDVLLDGVVTLSPKNTWAFAYDFTTKSPYSLHFNGSTWKQKPLPSSVDANSDTNLVSASSASNIWALTSSSGGANEAMRYNGSTWKVFKLPGHLAPTGQTVYTRQILALSKTNVWITAWTQGSSGQGPAVLLHWNGQAWAKVTGKLPTGALTGSIASDGHGGLWLGGATPTGFPRLFHYSNGTWVTNKVPADTLGPPNIAALALIPGTRSLLGVANLGVSFGGDKGAEILRYKP